jgi:hypothetical protein
MLKYLFVLVLTLCSCSNLYSQCNPDLFLTVDVPTSYIFTSLSTKVQANTGDYVAPSTPSTKIVPVQERVGNYREFESVDTPTQAPAKPASSPVQAPTQAPVTQPKLECHAPMIQYAPVSYEYRQAAPRRGILRRGWFRGGSGRGLFRGRFGGC